MLRKFIPIILLFCLSSCAQMGARRPSSIEDKNCLALIQGFVSPNDLNTTETSALEKWITKAHNIDFIHKLKNNSFKNEYFWNVENTILKTLNDKVYLDKTITHSQTLFFQQRILEKIFQEQELSKRLGSRYFDYKTLRLGFALDDQFDTKALEIELLKIYNQVNAEFAEYMQAKNLLSALETTPERIKSIDTWFLSGLGNSPDEAVLSARLARLKLSSNHERIFNFSEEERLFSSMLSNAQEKWLEIKKVFTNDPKKFLWSEIPNPNLPDGNSNIEVFSRDLLDLIRKTNFKSAEGPIAFKRKLKIMTGQSYSDENILLLVTYVEVLDTFSAAVVQEVTKKIDWQDNVSGFMSVDFAKKGAEGLQWINAIIQNKTDVAEVLTLSRESFWKVDQTLKDGRDYFVNSLMGENIPQYYHSGDDLVLFLTSKLKNIDRKNLTRNIANHSDAENFRVVFCPFNQNEMNQVSKRKSDDILNMGETFLKTYRIKIDTQFKRNMGSDFFSMVEMVPKGKSWQPRVYFKVKKPTEREAILDFNTKFATKAEFIEVD